MLLQQQEESVVLLGFKETTTALTAEYVAAAASGYKWVPWISWDDWNFVSRSLFSSSPSSISSALRRISAWRSRGRVPVDVEVTASIIEIQQQDPFFRNDLTDHEVSQSSEEILSMLYSMAIMRLVNGVVEKTRKKNEASIAEAAKSIGLPRMLIDIRHECSHRDLPSLKLVRLASIKALDWLKSNYWERQKIAIPSPADKAVNLKKEIKSAVRELALSLNIEHIDRSSSSVVKRKRSKKQISKVLKNFLRLYSSFPSDVASVVLQFLLKALSSADQEEFFKSSQVGLSTTKFQPVFDEWKPFILRLSNKEPEMLLTLLKGVLEVIEDLIWVKHELGGEHPTSLQEAEFCKIEQLSCLFGWLVNNLKELKPFSRQKSVAEIERYAMEMNLPKESLVDMKASLVDILRKCLLVSLPGSGQLIGSAVVLARIIGNDSLVEKLNKLALIHASDAGMNEENMSLSSHESFFLKQEEYICQAAKKLENVKINRMKGNKLQIAAGGGVGVNKRKWVVAKSWRPCPIGMLPSAVGSTGLLPLLDFDDDHEDIEKSPESNYGKWGLNQCSGSKREADCAGEVLDNVSVKKMKEGERYDDEEEDTLVVEGVKGRLMVDGVWKRVGEEDVLAIGSGIRILV